MTKEEVDYIYRGLKEISVQARRETDHGIACGMYKALGYVYNIMVNMGEDLNAVEKEGAENGKDD